MKRYVETSDSLDSYLLSHTPLPWALIHLIIDYAQGRYQGRHLATIDEVNGSYFASPYDVAVWKGLLDFFIITDHNNHRVVMCDQDGKLLRKIGGGYGELPGELSCPSFIALNHNEILISDEGNHRVQVFDARDGKLLRKFGTGSAGKSRGDLANPTGMTIMGSYLYVAERSNARLTVFDYKSGKFISHFGKGTADTRVSQPYGVTSHSGLIFIADSAHNRISIWDERGHYLSQIGLPTPYPELKDPGGRLHDPAATMINDTEIYITESESHRISIWDISTREYIRHIGKKGTNEGLFTCPLGIRMISVYEFIVCDSQNDRLQIFD